MNDTHQTLVSVNTKRFKVSTRSIQRLGFLICSYLGVSDFDLAVEFVGDAKMRRLNSTFRGKDKTTDVLSFPQVQWPKPLPVKKTSKNPQIFKNPPKTRQSSGDSLPCEPLGDIVISLAAAERNAKKIGQTLDREVCFLLVHGILHLCGHDHMNPEEERIMLKAQRTIMTLLGDNAPMSALWRNCIRQLKGNAK